MPLSFTACNQLLDALFWKIEDKVSFGEHGEHLLSSLHPLSAFALIDCYIRDGFEVRFHGGVDVSYAACSDDAGSGFALLNFKPNPK